MDLALTTGEIAAIVIALIFTVILAAVTLYFVLARNKKFKNREYKNEKVGKKLPFPPQLFINAFGGIKNIKKIEHSLTKITVFIEDNKLINHSGIQGLKASGIMEGTDKISLVLGKNSVLIAETMNEIISKHSGQPNK